MTPDALTKVAAAVFCVLTVVVVVFQLALAAGAPWGAASMGGRFPGRYPPIMRLVCLVQILVLAAIATLVLVRAGLVLPEWRQGTRLPIWGVVTFCMIAVVLNLLTPSRLERLLWAPIAAGLLASSLVVALSPI